MLENTAKRRAKHVCVCNACQRPKNQQKSVGSHQQKRQNVCLGSNHAQMPQMERMNEPNLKLRIIAMIEPMMGWFKMVQIPDAEAITVANAAETQWLSRCL